jgi:hypothetical protein
MSADGQSTERCGNCGAVVPVSAELCPVCGALLDAYRDSGTVPVESEPAPTPSTTTTPPPDLIPSWAVRPVSASVDLDGVDTIPPWAAEPAREPIPLLETDESYPVPAPTTLFDDPETLRAARQRLVRTLTASRRELVDLIEIHQTVDPSPSPTPVSSSQSPISASQSRSFTPVPRPLSPDISRPLRTPVAYPPTPQRPGFMVKGSITTPIVGSFALGILGCVVLGIGGSMNGSLSGLISSLGLLMWYAAVFLMIFAVFALLVRRERTK